MKNNIIQRILDWCKLAGIPQNGDDKQFNLWIDLMKEELEETITATEDNNNEGILDGLADLIWITCNWAYMNNLDLVSMLEKVDKSNYSKFCTSVEEAEETVKHYLNGTHWDKLGITIDCDWHKVDDYYVVKREDGKILKSINYKPVNEL